ncbi:MAG: PD-(D/E)XK nuclease family protein [Synechococcus sp.]
MSQLLQRITQAHLRVLDLEPYRFEGLYLDGVELPTVAGNLAAIERGKQFHQLLQQQEMGLPIQALIEADPDLSRYFQAFASCPPPLIEGQRRSEYPLAMPFQGVQLYGIPDLLVEASDRAQIVDWKTYRRSLDLAVLQSDWQTRLYLFLLAETRNYAPEQLSMLYWFSEQPSQWVEVSYDADTHAQNGATIRGLLHSLRGWITSGFPTAPCTQVDAPQKQKIAAIPPVPLP